MLTRLPVIEVETPVCLTRDGGMSLKMWTRAQLVWVAMIIARDMLTSAQLVCVTMLLARYVEMLTREQLVMVTMLQGAMIVAREGEMLTRSLMVCMTMLLAREGEMFSSRIFAWWVLVWAAMVSNQVLYMMAILLTRRLGGTVDKMM